MWMLFPPALAVFAGQAAFGSPTPAFFNNDGNASCTSTAKPYMPSGGLGTSPGDVPVYNPMSDFDFASLTLALYQEYIELDLFHHGLAQFSQEEFQEAGISPEDMYLIQWMAEQEVGHAQLITNMLGPGNASFQCNYTYPFNTVREFIDFSMKVTRFGESGTFGFLEHLNSRASASLLLEAISTESRQEMVFRQLEGLFPMPFWFTPAITQSMQWTLLAPYISSCPQENKRIEWQNFPGLGVVNSPNASILTNETMPGISTNRTTPLSQPGNQLNLTWENPGKQVGPDLSYNTTTSAGAPKYAAWISQLNTTYTPLDNINSNWATTVQPDVRVYGGDTAALINGTIFILITDDNPYVTTFNLSLLNDHVVAGPAVYVAG